MELPGLSFAVGRRFEDELRASSGLPVSLSPADSFLLVVAFGRCKFRLTPDSVGLILQATIGGFASFFKVASLSDRVFKFTVASKEVGLIIRCLFSFECTNFKLFFHLWGGGGTDWRSEFKLFLEEERNSWSHAPSGRFRPHLLLMSFVCPQPSFHCPGLTLFYLGKLGILLRLVLMLRLWVLI